MTELQTLFLVAAAVACVAWTITNEEIFKEPRAYCVERAKDNAAPWYCRKFFYLFTCQYCFSHYVTAFFLWLTGFRLLVPGFAGTVVAFFVCVALANVYMTVYSIGRQAFRILSKTAR